MLQRSAAIIRSLDVGVVRTHHGAHHLRIAVVERGGDHGCIVGGRDDAVHHINHTVVGHERLGEHRFVGRFRRILRRREHLVTRIVHDGVVLRRHRFDERVLHQVVHQRLNDVERNLIDVLEQVLFGIRFLRIAFDQRATTLRNKIIGHGGIVGHEHRGHIFDAGHGARQLVSIPTRIVGQERNTIVGQFLIRFRLQTSAARIDREIALFEHRVHSSGIACLISFGQYIIIEGRAETIQDVAEHLRVVVLANHLGHIGGRHEHFVQHMEIAIQADHVSLVNARIKNIGARRFRLAPTIFVIQNERHIRTLDILLAHVSFEEVRDHRTRSIDSHIDTLRRTAVVTFPILLFVLVSIIVYRQLFRTPKLHRVDSFRCRLLAQTQILSSARSIAHHFEHISIVQLRTVEEYTLLSVSELFIRMNSPRIVLEEFLISLVVRHKKRLTTRLRHHVLIAQVVNQTNGILKAARIQFVVDATPKKRRFLHIQRIVLT